RYVLAVAGGKGGVGKSTTAVNLALTLAAMGERVGLLDCDINAPDVPHMLGMQVKRGPAQATLRPQASLRPMSEALVAPARRRRPHERYGVEMMSVGMEIPERLPPRVTSRLQVSTLLRNLVFEVNWSARILILDAPPGTGEELQTIAGELPLSGALLVTTPQDLAQMDAERTLTLLAEHNVPVAGMVKNMASLTCPHCSQDIDMYASSARLGDAGVPIIGAIPFDVVLSSAADRGVPLVLSDPRGPIAYEFARIGAYVRRWIAERASVQV
ncbi:MAG: P-loop NTPase, partial [Chloroflexi bacterium]|nr:P-loop NTPase [Chloroflexota bacterium]